MNHASAQHHDGPVVVEVLALAEPAGEWTRHTLELAGDAAKLAGRLGGCVRACVLTADNAADPAALGRHGCHEVEKLSHPRLASWSSETVAAALAQAVSPSTRVMLLPGTSRGEEAAALLAERLETAWIADALTMSVTRSGVIEITSVDPGGKLARTFRMADERLAVVTIRPGVAEIRPVDPPIDPEVRLREVDLSDTPELTAVEELIPADPRTVDVAWARRIVAGGRGTGGPEGMRRLAELAEVLSAAPAASRMAVDLGWAPSERQIGQTGKTVRPGLYVACGISGASHHLAGMRDSQHIVAVNHDPNAPIHEVAHLSLYGDLNEVVPAIASAVKLRMTTNQPPDP